MLLPTPELVTRAQQGSPDAAGQLYERHYQDIFRYLVYRTGDSHAAEDLTGDVFLKMVQALPGYRLNGTGFRAWLYQIARNLAIDHYRRNRARPTTSLGDGVADGSEHIEETAARSLTSQELREAVARLSDDQRDVILLRFVVGFSLAETARSLHKTEDAVKGLQRRGLMSLRENLELTEERYG